MSGGQDVVDVVDVMHEAPEQVGVDEPEHVDM